MVSQVGRQDKVAHKLSRLDEDSDLAADALICNRELAKPTLFLFPSKTSLTLLT